MARSAFAAARQLEVSALLIRGEIDEVRATGAEILELASGDTRRR